MIISSATAFRENVPPPIHVRLLALPVCLLGVGSLFLSHLQCRMTEARVLYPIATAGATSLLPLAGNIVECRACAADADTSPAPITIDRDPPAVCAPLYSYSSVGTARSSLPCTCQMNCWISPRHSPTILLRETQSSFSKKPPA